MRRSRGRARSRDGRLALGARGTAAVRVRVRRSAFRSAGGEGVHGRSRDDVSGEKRHHHHHHHHRASWSFFTCGNTSDFLYGFVAMLRVRARGETRAVRETPADALRAGSGGRNCRAPASGGSRPASGLPELPQHRLTATARRPQSEGASVPARRRRRPAGSARTAAPGDSRERGRVRRTMSQSPRAARSTACAVSRSP